MSRIHYVTAAATLAIAASLFTTRGFTQQSAAPAVVRDLANLLAAPQNTTTNTNNVLVGLWKLTKGSFNGKEFSVREGQTVLKLQTATTYVWIDIDESGNLADLVGGSYTLTGGKYQPRPSFGVGGIFNRVKGTTQSFDYRVDGDTWYHKGTLSDGKSTIDEVWERIGR